MRSLQTLATAFLAASMGACGASPIQAGTGDELSNSVTWFNDAYVNTAGGYDIANDGPEAGHYHITVLSGAGE